MTFTSTIPDADVPALSAQFASRTPLLEGEAADDHVVRAVGELLNVELTAARARAATATVEAAKNDTELESALLAEHKLKTGVTATTPVMTTK